MAAANRPLRNSWPLSVRHQLQPPAPRGEIGRDAPCEGGGPRRGGRASLCRFELGPAEPRVHVDRRVLPDRALGPVEPTDEEAVELHHRPWSWRVQVPLGLGGTLGLGRRLVPGDQAEPSLTARQPVPTQAPVDPIGGHDDAAPALTSELRGDPARPMTRIGKGERQDPMLHVRRELVRHPRAPALLGPQRLQAPHQDLSTPAVEGRGMHAHDPARLTDVAELTRQGKQSHPLSVDDIIESQAASPFGATWWSRRRMRRLSLSVWELPATCRENLESVHPRRRSEAPTRSS